MPQPYLQPLGVPQMPNPQIVLQRLVADNNKLQTTLLQHMSDSKQQINTLIRQNETLQSKLQKALDQNTKLSDRILDQPLRTPTLHQPVIDLLDMNSQPCPSSQPIPAAPTAPLPASNQPNQGAIQKDYQHRTVEQANKELIEHLIKITETQVILQNQRKETRNVKFPTFNGDDMDEFISWNNNVLSILAST